MMLDLNDEIGKLKEEGLSLRGIAKALGISHEAVRKRLKSLEGKEQVSTREVNQGLTASVIGNHKVSTRSNAPKSRASEKIKDTVNQVSTPKIPPLPLSACVSPLAKRSGKPTEDKKEVFQEVLSECGDLLEAIREFLELNGVELYRMQVSQEAYQIKYNGQTIRFYVFR